MKRDYFKINFIMAILALIFVVLTYHTSIDLRPIGSSFADNWILIISFGILIFSLLYSIEDKIKEDRILKYVTAVNLIAFCLLIVYGYLGF